MRAAGGQTKQAKLWAAHAPESTGQLVHEGVCFITSAKPTGANSSELIQNHTQIRVWLDQCARRVRRSDVRGHDARAGSGMHAASLTGGAEAPGRWVCPFQKGDVQVRAVINI